MSYDISYYQKETYNNIEQRELIKVAPFIASGGTVRAELLDGKLVPAIIEDCEINITYNYAPFYYKHIDSELGIRWLYGKTGEEVKKRLEEAIFHLGINKDTTPFWQINVDFTIGSILKKTNLLPVSEEKFREYLKVEDWDNHPDKNTLIENGFLQNGGSYWKSTPGNAGHALMRILTWIIQNPHGIFDGD